MTRTETERLTRMEDNQDNFAKALEEIFKRLDRQDTVLIRVDKTLNELTGGKRALIWFTGVALTITGLVISLIHELKK